jgi:hypothetical protein
MCLSSLCSVVMVFILDVQPNATREEIEDVARMAFSHEFITSMADGYDTEVRTDSHATLQHNIYGAVMTLTCSLKLPY